MPLAPSVTLAQVEGAIVGETFTVLPDGRTTICQLTLYNNFTVEGSSACVSKENFNAEKGNKYAHEKALTKVWEVLGFGLCESLWQESIMRPSEKPVVSLQPLPPTVDYPQVVLGQQVLFYERVGEEESEAMLALVTSVIDADHVALAVFAPNGTAHARQRVYLLLAGEDHGAMTIYARRKS